MLFLTTVHAFSGVIDALVSSFNITNSAFTNNTVAVSVGGVTQHNAGGVIGAYSAYFNITSSVFTNNIAGVGGVLHATNSPSFIIVGSSFYANKAYSYGGVMFTTNCSILIADSAFYRNLGSLYVFNSNLTISGYSRFENGSEWLNKSVHQIRTSQEGGAITSFQSTLIFTGVSSLSNNQARQGGAILATESKITMYGVQTITNNTAINGSGGGISLQQSEFEINGNCKIFGNYAARGGGIHSSGSIIAVYQPAALQFVNNRAKNGSGLYLEVKSRLYILKSKSRYSLYTKYLLFFTDNHADYGGAIYMSDITNSGACLADNECFIQTLALHKMNLYKMNIANIHFYGNIASWKGSNIYGGLLDRCIPSPFAEVYLNNEIEKISYYSAINYLSNISNLAPQMSALDTISSLPVRVCFCVNESYHDCGYRPKPFMVKKGEAFNVPLIAVDQVNHSVEANIISSLSSQEGGFGEGQQTQSVKNTCTNVTFNVFSPHDFEIIHLYADGPCGSANLSLQYLDIHFSNCTCPVGFESLNSETRCQCICDPKLSPYITKCNPTTETLVSVNTNSWISYINDTHSPGYVIHPNCPFDYCQPPTVNVSMNLNLPNGADAQCAYNRRGVLCGACQEPLSLSLGSTRCLPCQNHSLAVLFVILLAAIVAGLLLVTALLALNMTVTVGLINGFIFYANIVAANGAIFFHLQSLAFLLCL